MPLHFHGFFGGKAVQNGTQQPFMAAGAKQPVQHELPDRSVPDDARVAENRQMAGDRRLGQLQDLLQIGNEQRSRGQTVDDTKPGRFRDHQQQSGRSGPGHMRLNEYLFPRRDATSSVGSTDSRPRDELPPTPRPRQIPGIVSPNPESVLAFINERLVRLPPGTSVLAAVRAYDPALADRIAAGEGYCTDGRGLPLEPDTPLESGGIVRAVISARRRPDADADA